MLSFFAISAFRCVFFEEFIVPHRHSGLRRNDDEARFRFIERRRSPRLEGAGQTQLLALSVTWQESCFPSTKRVRPQLRRKQAIHACQTRPVSAVAVACCLRAFRWPVVLCAGAG